MMGPEERNDLNFLLSLRTKREWQIWAAMASDVDKLYAAALIRERQLELDMQALERSDEVNDVTQAQQVLKNIMSK